MKHGKTEPDHSLNIVFRGVPLGAKVGIATTKRPTTKRQGLVLVAKMFQSNFCDGHTLADTVASSAVQMTGVETGTGLRRHGL